jgi:hypothetical protein
MADTENQNTQVNEEPKETQVDITDTTIVSNGEVIDTDNTEGGKAEEETTTDEKDTKEEDKPAEEQEEYQKAKGEIESAKTELEGKGIDYAALEAEYNEKGELSKDSYKLLEEKGYPKALVEAAIAGWQAKADAFANKIIEDAGGINEYERIKNFVQSQGAGAVNAFNAIVNKDDLSVVSAYIAGVKAQMVAQHGTANPTLGGSGNVGKSKGYADANEMIKAMSDPRYGKDLNYMHEVERKVAASKFFG